MKQAQVDLSEEILEQNVALPADLTKKIAKEIADFAKVQTTKIFQECQSQVADQN